MYNVRPVYMYMYMYVYIYVYNVRVHCTCTAYTSAAVETLVSLAGRQREVREQERLLSSVVVSSGTME